MARWGKAGVRLTADETRQRDNQKRLRALQKRQRREAAEVADRLLWAAGQVKPYRITFALDSKALYGPEVDIACGAREPDVDLWEAGECYPTWEQLKALAQLCGVTTRFFLVGEPPFPVEATTLRFHLNLDQLPPEPPVVWRFKQAAVAAVVTA